MRGVGPDERHPFILRDTRLWNNFWAFRPGSPSVQVDGMDIYNGRYGLYRPVYDRHAYARLTIAQVENPQAFAQGETPRGFDVPGPSEQPGRPSDQQTIRRLAAEVAGRSRSARGDARNGVDASKRPVPPRIGPGQPVMNPLIVEPRYAAYRASSLAFPTPLHPVDDLPPATVITHAVVPGPGRLIVRGTTSDGGVVKRVSVNGREARPLTPNFAEWEVSLPAPEDGLELIAFAEDVAGNVEMRPHRIKISRP